MKVKHLLLTLTFLLGSCLFLQLHAQDIRVALVDYMYVPEGMDGEYVSMEKEIAKPIHEEMVKQGVQDAWYLFRIPFPGGTNAKYHYATVRIFSSAKQLGNANQFGSAMSKVHGENNLDKVGEQIMRTRDLVKTHRIMSWERFAAKDLEKNPEIIQVVYFKVPFGKEGDYQKLEREIYHPMHKKEIELGARAGWEGWWLQNPSGSMQPYNYVAVDMYKDWGQYYRPPTADLLKMVHPDKKWSDLEKMHIETVDMVNIEEWHLVDFVEK